MGFLRRIMGSARPQPARPGPPVEPTVAPPADSSPTVPCPHCGVILDPIPKRRRLCPACRQPIIPRNRADGARVVLRAEDLPEFEEWNRAWPAAHERELWIAKARQFVDEAGFVDIESELAASKPGYTLRDVYRVAASWAILDMIRRKDWGGLANAYYRLALEDHDESDQQEVSEHVLNLLRGAAKAQLREYLAHGVRRVDITTCGCSVCSRRPKHRLPIRDELTAPHIPHAQCRQGFCNCEYLPVVE